MIFSGWIAEILDCRKWKEQDTNYTELDIIAHTDDDEPTYYTATIRQSCSHENSWSDWEVVKETWPIGRV